MGILLAVAIITIFVLLIPKRQALAPGANLRKRTDEQYRVIMAASNWSPDHFHLCEDGKYRNARGEIGIKMTFSELAKTYAPQNAGSEE